MNAPQLLTIGEAMALVTPADASPLVAAIEFRVETAGAEANVASHCAALGIRSAWVSAVGADPLGDRLLATIAGRGVDTTHVVTSQHAPTGVYFKDPGARVYYYRSSSAASHMGSEMVATLPLAPGQVLHLSGITPALSPSCAELTTAALLAARSHGGVVSFDVNYRSALWSPTQAGPVLAELARSSDIVFVGLDEAHTLWGTTSAQQVREFLPDVRLVVKNDDVGATDFDGENEVFVAPEPVEVVEVVGAGDAFAAGYLAATIQGESARERLQAGHNRAAHVLLSTSDFVSGE